MIRARDQRGITLLEALVFSSVIVIVAAMSMRSIGQGRIMRANARDRLVMATIAQGELDRIRLNPSTIQAGSTEKTDPAWPSGTSATIVTEPGPDGTWKVEVRMARASYEGKTPVRLATLVSSTASPATRAMPETAPGGQQ